MHHTLVVYPVFSIGSHVNHNGRVFRQTCLEIGFLPLELFVLGIRFWVQLALLRVSVWLFLSTSRKSEELQMHVFDEVEVTIYRVMINFFWVIFINDFERIFKIRESNEMAVGIVVSA